MNQKPYELFMEQAKANHYMVGHLPLLDGVDGVLITNFSTGRTMQETIDATVECGPELDDFAGIACVGGGTYEKELINSSFLYKFSK